MSKLYLSDPTTEPHNILATLGVWTPKEYEQELRKLRLDEEDIEDRMSAFRERHADCADYYRQMLEFDLKRDVSDVDTHKIRDESKRMRRSRKQRGGASGFSKIQDDDPNYRPNITLIDMLAKDMLDKDENFQIANVNYDEDAQREIRACSDVSVYNIDGKPLPTGKILEECVNIYRAKDNERQMYHRSLLEAAIECKRKGVSDGDLETCVYTKLAEMKALLETQSRILNAIGNELQKTELDIQTLVPGEKSDLNNLQQQHEKANTQEKQTWTKWIITKIKDSSVWLAGKGADLAMWVIKDPKTAKIVFFILKRMLKDACKYVYMNYLKNEKQYMSMFQNFLTQTKDFVLTKAEFAKYAVMSGIQTYFLGDGFKNTWKKASSHLGAAIYGLVGQIPIVGGAVQVVGGLINDILFESAEIYIQVAIYEADLKFSGRTFLEIILFLMPVQVVQNPQGGFSLQWNTSTESCVGILRQRQIVVGTAPLSDADTKKLQEDAKREYESGNLTRVGNPLAQTYTTTQAVDVDLTADQTMQAPAKKSGWFWGGGRNTRPTLPPHLSRSFY